MQRRITPHFTSALCLLFLTLLLHSCADQEPVKPDPQPPVQNPLPDKLCGVSFESGYTNQVSYGPDEKVTAYLQSKNEINLCRLDIYNINKVLAFSVATSLKVQNIKNAHPAEAGYGYNPTVEFEIPKGTPSGIYLIEKKVPFIVKTVDPVDLVIVYPSNTVNAYCTSGGASLYPTTLSPGSKQVSFSRPMEIQNFCSSCLTWFSTINNYRIGYIADSDLDNFDNIKDAKILIIPGHSEYWTRPARLNFDTFVNQGGDALILSGNVMWWQVRYAEDQDKLICYRTEDADPGIDPLLKTITWDSPSLAYSILSSIGADFPHGGYGLKSDDGWNGYKIAAPNSPLLEGLKMSKGDILLLPTTEYDGAPISHYEDGYPVIDREMLNAEKVELIGFDKGARFMAETTSTFFIMQKSSLSGIIVNTSSTDWCSLSGMGGTSGPRIKKITLNAIDKLMNNENIFTE